MLFTLTTHATNILILVCFNVQLIIINTDSNTEMCVCVCVCVLEYFSLQWIIIFLAIKFDFKSPQKDTQIYVCMMSISIHKTGC